MELRYLRYFVAVAEARNFTRAARELGISQPPLSQQIQRLEREIGTPLLRRLTRGIELTEAGESFYEDACQILALSDAALEKTKGIARGMNGRLALGITSSNAFHPQIFALLRQFQRRYPAVALRQVEGNMAALMSALGEGELDIAFVRLPCESSKAFNLRISMWSRWLSPCTVTTRLPVRTRYRWYNCRRPRRFCFRVRWPRDCMSRSLIAVCAPVSICSRQVNLRNSPPP